MAKQFKKHYDPREFEEFKRQNLIRISTFEDLVDAFIEDAKEAQFHRWQTGYKTIDNFLRLSRSDIVTIMSHTGGRKTQFTRNIVRANSPILKDKLILVFSLELLEGDEGERYLTMLLDDTGEKLEKEAIADERVFRKRALEKKLGNLITVTGSIDIADMIPFARTVEEVKEKKIGLIVLDYIQLVENDEKRNAYDQAGDVAKKLKKVNMVLQCPIINVSQVHRSAAKGNIDMFSGKGSGEIENSSQVMLKLELPHPNERYKIEKGEPDWKKLPFGKDQEAVVNYLKSNRDIEMHKLTILKRKKVKYGVEQPTCYIGFNKRNLAMIEFIPQGKAPIIENPKEESKEEDDQLPF